MKLSRNQAGVSKLAMFLAPVLIIGLIFWGWQIYKQRQTKQSSTNSQATELAIYENEELGLKFSYPKTWGPIYFERQYGCGKTGSAYSLSFKGKSNFSGGGVFGGMYSHDYAAECKLRTSGFDDYPTCKDMTGSYFTDFYQAKDVCVKGYAERTQTFDRTGVIIQKAFSRPTYGGIEIEAGGFTLGDFSQSGLTNYYSDEIMKPFIQDFIKLAQSIKEI